MGRSLADEGRKTHFDKINSLSPSYLSVIFSPGSKNILVQISKLLRYFLWRGGKKNQNYMHLVKWETVKRPVNEGGLQIRDPVLSNLTMGGKLL